MLWRLPSVDPGALLYAFAAFEVENAVSEKYIVTYINLTHCPRENHGPDDYQDSPGDRHEDEVEAEAEGARLGVRVGEHGT